MKHVYISLEDTFKQNKFFQELRILGLKKNHCAYFSSMKKKCIHNSFEMVSNLGYRLEH